MSVEEKFQAAVNVIKGLPKDGPYQPSNEMALKFYGLYKQATEGPCQVPKPSFYQLVAGYKWQAWKALGEISKEEAMDRYVRELKKIVETMAYSADVATFMEALGPFYEYVDVPGNNNYTKCVKRNAEPDDTSQEEDEMAEDPPLEISNEDPPSNESVEHHEANSIDVETVETVTSEVVLHASISMIQGDLNEGVPFRNGRLPTHDIANGVVTKAFYMASPQTAAEQNLNQQHRSRQQQQQQLQQLNDGRTDEASDTDTDEEYSEPSESLVFCSGSSGDPANTKVAASYEMPERLAKIEVEEQIHVDGSRNLGGTTNGSLANGDSTGQYLYSNNGAYSAERTLNSNGATLTDGQYYGRIATDIPQHSSNEAIGYTNGHLQMSPSCLNCDVGSGQSVALPVRGNQQQMANMSAGQPVAMVCSRETVQALQQMQAELSSLTRCLDAHLSDISRGLVALREPINALQNQNRRDLTRKGDDAERRHRHWRPALPELSRRSTVWLLLWPVFVHLAIKALGAAIALRRKRNK